MSARRAPSKKATDILVVEASSTQAEMLRFMLEEKGYRVALARDGKKALACMNGYLPSLIISDIIMPEMDGYELCRQIKADENTQAIRCILLTSLCEATDVMQGLACGADGFISKPYTEDYLLLQVDKALANLAGSKNGHVPVELEVTVAGKPQPIRANPQQIVSLTLSIYEAAIHRNTELLQSQDDLRLMNEHLEDLVEQRTAALSSEIAERKRLQSELSELSLHDELTGLLNRRGFTTLAEQYYRLALRLRQDFAILYLDMDDLKQINDSLGRAAGDRALQTLACAMERSFRDSDILARLGGDEFSVLFVEYNQGLVRRAVARLEKNMNLLNAEGTDLPLLSVSVGIAQFSPDTKPGINELLEQADADMYIQKQQAYESRLQ